MYLKPFPILVCFVYITIRIAQAYEDEQIETALRLLEHLSETRKGLTALKRVISDIDADLKQSQSLKELSRKRNGLQVLKRILNEMDSDVIVEQKRTCMMNLGGHCATENAAAIADQWHYLNSHLSPGRKRRDTGVYKKLMAGKLVNQ